MNKTDPIPLRSMLHQAGTDPGDRLLGQALWGLYPDTALKERDAGWGALEAEALRLAHKRSRRYHLWELVKSFGQTHFLAYTALAVVPLVVGWFLWPPRPALMVAHGPAHPVIISAPVTTAQTQREARLTLQAGADQKQARILCGAQLKLDRGHADIEQSNAHRPRITLHDGLLAVQVPTLGSGGKLVVVTADAEVIVHGTRFQVDKRQADSTQVVVQEGLVEVRPLGGRQTPVFLRAGEQLTVPSARAYRLHIEKQVEERIESRSCEDKSGALDVYLDTAPRDVDTSAALYLKGSCAADRGERETALSCFERVTASSPNVTRADNALARIAQLHATGSLADGAAAWRRYLLRFPQGLHRESAQLFLKEAARGRKMEPIPPGPESR